MFFIKIERVALVITSYSIHYTKLYDTLYVERFLAYFSVDSSTVLFGNSVGDYALSFTVFLFGLAIFALVQYFALSWLAFLSKKTESYNFV